MAKEYFWFSSSNNSTRDMFLFQESCREDTVKSFLHFFRFFSEYLYRSSTKMSCKRAIPELGIGKTVLQAAR